MRADDLATALRDPGPYAAKAHYGGSYIWSDLNCPQVRALEAARPRNRVLEIGSGHGGITRELHGRFGCAVTVVEVDPECRTSVGQACERFVVGSIDDDATLDLIRGDYDFVVLFDVLEHLPRPDRTLERLRAATGNATFVITLPNFLSWGIRSQLLRGRFEYTDSGTLDRTHLRFFTPSSAAQLVESAGLEIARCDRTWDVPGLGILWSLLITAEADNLRWRVAKHVKGPLVGWTTAALELQHRLNSAGLLRFFNAIGRLLSRLFPVLFVDHVILVAKTETPSLPAGSQLCD
jgi:SAM-dependent methyltransferase